MNRTAEILAALPQLDDVVADPRSAESIQPAYAQNEARSMKPELLVLVGICTRVGCLLLAKLEGGTPSGHGREWRGGFSCPGHDSKFDLAGRVYKNVPAPTNLVAPPYAFLSDTRVIVGEHPEEGVA